ncbi:MAG: hypothetical protein IKS98_08485 [Lachnospiraceae bacterium]|nr:hypothetical protein [Lachnospiraceae bacterium]
MATNCEVYYYKKSNYYIEGAFFIELFLVFLGGLLYEVLYGNLLFGEFVALIIALLLSGYLSACYVISYKNGRLHMELKDGVILIYRIYRIKPLCIIKNEIKNIEKKKQKNGFVFKIYTTKRNYKVYVKDEEI